VSLPPAIGDGTCDDGSEGKANFQCATYSCDKFDCGDDCELQHCTDGWFSCGRKSNSDTNPCIAFVSLHTNIYGAVCE
jgi:hypothetical protein